MKLSQSLKTYGQSLTECGWWKILTVSSFLATSCVSTEMLILVILSVEVWVGKVSCLINLLCVIPANLAVFKLHLRHL